ncbi:P27 family phage terminase small subunit [Mycolicibacterium hippocampi]|uniref:P27 family phage terminase small subunit n=1 Tax=Mycolicibacterium hippocampi TaxID=659824 RepID=UPI0013D61499|nr:P27 family phage terminase small subunit [Mycolicibacterium hippocampi]
MSPKASELWDVIVEDLEAAGTLKISDGPAIEMLCEEYATWSALRATIRKQGRFITRPSGVKVRNPATADQRESQIAWQRLATFLGLDAAAVARRLAAAGGSTDDDDDTNPFAWAE